MTAERQFCEACRIPEEVSKVIDALGKIVERDQLPSDVRQKITAAVRQAVLPRQKRRKHPQLDAAYADHQAGMRGLALYRKHIANHDKKSRYRRRTEERRLMNSIHQRSSREKRARRTLPPSDGTALTAE